MSSTSRGSDTGFTAHGIIDDMYQAWKDGLLRDDSVTAVLGEDLAGLFYAQMLEDHEREPGLINTLPEREPTSTQFDSGT